MSRVHIASLSSGTEFVAAAGGGAALLAGQSVYVYATGTTTPVTVWADSSTGATLTQPLQTNGSGQLPGYLDSGQTVDFKPAGPAVTTDVLSASGVESGISKMLSPTGVGDADSAALASALTNFAPFASPKIKLAEGTFNWGGTVPGFLRNMPAEIVGAGRGRTTIRLNGSARFFDFTKVADYDVFHHITIRNVTLDANNTGGKNAGIGNYAAGAIQTRIQWRDMLFEDIEGINGAAPDATATNEWRWFNLWSKSDEGDTLMTVSNITFRDCFLSGGAYGFQAVASSITGGAHYSNTLYDRIHLHNCHHDTGTVPTQFIGSANFHFGSAGFGRSIRLYGCTGQNSADVGIELDGFVDAVGQGCRITDQWGFAYYNTNFATIPGLAAQRTVWRDCKWRRSAQNSNAVSGSCVGWRSTTTANFATQYPSQLEIHGCIGHDDTGNLKTLGDFITVDSTRRLIVSDFTIIHEAIATTPNTGNLGAIKVRNGVGGGAMGVCHIDLKDIKVYVNGAVSLTGFTYSPVLLSNTGESYLDIDGLDVDWTLTGASSTTYRGIQVGDSAAGQTSNGRIRKYRILQISGDASPRFIVINDTAWVTIPDKFEVTACDWSKAAAGTEIVFSTPGGGSAQTGKVYAYQNRWKTNPAPSTLTGLVTATGAALNTNTACNATFTQGSGTAITAIDYSTNGGTTYTNFLTQASGALPAGFDQTIPCLRPQDLIKVTFTGTQPTINLVPIDP